MSKKILALNTGLFDVDPVLASTIETLPQTKSIDLQQVAPLTSDDWDAIMKEILAADQIITI